MQVIDLETQRTKLRQRERARTPGGIGVCHPSKTYAIFFCSLVISIV